jgi:hypothetical protein
MASASQHIVTDHGLETCYRYLKARAQEKRRTMAQGRRHPVPIDLSQVDWLYVAVLAVFVFVATFVANLLSFGRRGHAAVLAAILFAAIFVFWTYYPHGLPLPTSMAAQKSSVTPVAPAASSVPQKPSNPVTDITPSPGSSR